MNTGMRLAAVFIAFLFQIPLKAQTMNTKENQSTTNDKYSSMGGTFN